jgi:hypothetical protein
MLAYYFEAGPRLGDPTLARADGTHQGLSSASNLNRNENLIEVPQPQTEGWALNDLAFYLRKWGPLLISFYKSAAGGIAYNANGKLEQKNYTRPQKAETYGHCCAIIGVNDQRKMIHYHDPENKPNSEMRIDKFNDLFYWATDGMLRKNVPSHTPRTIARDR